MNKSLNNFVIGIEFQLNFKHVKCAAWNRFITYESTEASNRRHNRETRRNTRAKYTQKSCKLATKNTSWNKKRRIGEPYALQEQKDIVVSMYPQSSTLKKPQPEDIHQIKYE